MPTRRLHLMSRATKRLDVPLPAGAGEHAQLAVIERHKAAIRSVQFNPHQAAQHLLAVGSADGDISIINLESPGAPTIAS